MSDMALGMTERLKPIHERVAAHGPRRDHAARRGVPCRGRQERRRPLGPYRAPDRDPRRAEGQGQGARPVEFLADRVRARLRPHHRRIRLSRRGDGQGASRRRDLQLLGARHRQHGGAGALRLGRAQAAMAGAAARRQDPLGLSDDRARRRLVRRHQHRHALRAPTATTMCSTARNGGRPAPAIRAARSTSSWSGPAATGRSTSSIR